MTDRTASERRGLGRLAGPPLIVQLIGLLVGALIAAQLVTLLLTLVLPPAPPREYRLGDIAAALAGAAKDDGRFDRVVQSGPPDLSARGWFVSDAARRRLAGLLRRPVNVVALGFYTQLPVGGAVEPVAAPRQLPGDAARAPARHIGLLAPPLSADPQPTGNVEVAFSGDPGVHLMTAALQQMPGGPRGGFPGGGPPGGGFPGAGLPGGGFPQSLPRPPQPFPRAPQPQIQPPTPQPRGLSAPTQPQSPQAAAPSQATAPTTAQPLGAPLAAVPPGGTGLTPFRGDAPSTDVPADRAGPQFGGGGLPAGRAALAPSLPSGRHPSLAIEPAASSSPPPTAKVGTSAADNAVRAPSTIESAPAPTAPVAPIVVPATGAAATAGTGQGPAMPEPGERAAGLSPPVGRPVPIVRPAPGLFGLAPAPFVEGDFVAGVRRADGRWAVVSPRAEGFPNAWQRRVALWFLLSLLAVAPIAWLFARRIVGPLNEFAHAADVLGRDPGAAVLPLDGPAEIGRAAHAFNQMQSRLRSFVDDRTAMIGAISHDLRTPLTRLRFRIEDVPEEQQDDLRGEVAEMEAMISSVIAFMRDASIPNARERRDLAEIVDDVVEDATLLGDVRAVRVESAIVDVDPLGIRRVLDNLLTNAIKYGGGHARVALRVERDRAVADIVDSGPGVPDGELERIFEPFYRSEAARSSGREGSGLGLAVCRSIARAHGGDVALFRSTDGFTARVTLPLAYGDAEANRRRAA